MFVITVIPKRMYYNEMEHQDRTIRYRVAHAICKDDPERHAHDDRKTLYADTKEEADVLAHYMAGKHGGCDVYVCQAVSIFASANPEVFQKQISEEGVLPF